MARIRTVKPELARHRLLYEMEQETGVNHRFAWAMLPSACDREGRFLWRPWDLKLDCLPYDPVDFEPVLERWLAAGMVVKYADENGEYGWIPTWDKHQRVPHREAQSKIPSFTPELQCSCSAVAVQLQGKARGEGEGEGEREGDISIPSVSHPISRENRGRVNGKTAQIEEIFDFLCDKTGKRYRPIHPDGKLTKDGRIVENNLKHGYTVQEHKTCFVRMSGEWADSPEMQVYLRPETIFGPKFPGYLARCVAPPEHDEDDEHALDALMGGDEHG